MSPDPDVNYVNSVNYTCIEELDNKDNQRAKWFEDIIAEEDSSVCEDRIHENNGDYRFSIYLP